jgi:hypothetical protein
MKDISNLICSIIKILKFKLCRKTGQDFICSTINEIVDFYYKLQYNWERTFWEVTKRKKN